MPKPYRRLDFEYAETMQNHPFGIALYFPPSTSIFRPGTVGYFDSYGSWNVIADLGEAADLVRDGFTAPMGLVKAPVDDCIKWGPKTSSNTKATKVDLSAGIDPIPGIPVTASAVYSYQIDSDRGSILLTSPPITHERYYHSSPFKEWMKRNAATILDRWQDEAKEYGIWIVTSTFSTKKCAINMWNARGKGLKVGFSADVVGAGQVGPSLDWYKSNSDEGWAEYTAEGKNRSVVFFGGIKFQFSRNFRRVASLNPAGSHPGMSRSGLPPYDIPSGEAIDIDDTTHTDEEETSLEHILTLPDPEDEDKEYILYCEGTEDDEREGGIEGAGGSNYSMN